MAKNRIPAALIAAKQAQIDAAVAEFNALSNANWGKGSWDPIRKCLVPPVRTPTDAEVSAARKALTDIELSIGAELWNLRTSGSVPVNVRVGFGLVGELTFLRGMSNETAVFTSAAYAHARDEKAAKRKAAADWASGDDPRSGN